MLMTKSLRNKFAARGNCRSFLNRCFIKANEIEENTRINPDKTQKIVLSDCELKRLLHDATRSSDVWHCSKLKLSGSVDGQQIWKWSPNKVCKLLAFLKSPVATFSIFLKSNSCMVVFWNATLDIDLMEL